MTERTLTLILQPDWRAALRAAGRKAGASTYQGEVLHFESASALFGRLTERRCAIVQALQRRGAMSVRELARQVQRDVKPLRADVEALTELGLIERTAGGGVVCPFASVHIDFELRVGA